MRGRVRVLGLRVGLSFCGSNLDVAHGLLLVTSFWKAKIV